MKVYTELLADKLRKPLQDNKAIQELAIFGLIHGLSQGYCEFTEHKELMEICEKFMCPYCGRMHRSKLHDALNELCSDQERYDKAVLKAAQATKKEGLELYLASIAEHDEDFDKSLLVYGKEGEYTPE